MCSLKYHQQFTNAPTSSLPQKCLVEPIGWGYDMRVVQFIGRIVKFICILNQMLTKQLQYLFSNATKYKVVFLRHGESLWNKENRFTGWTDVRLTSNGIQEAVKAGKALQQNGYQFDICYTSVLTRAIQTFNYAAEELDCHYIPVVKDWRLNERHYGALQGLNKLETVEKHGKEQVQIWRRSYDIPPPELEDSDPRHPKNDRRYRGLTPQQFPKTESLKITIDRVLPYWNNVIVPTIKSEKRVLVVAHGNSLRAIVKVLSNVSDTDITELNIPTAIPLIYEFDADFKVLKHSYLADPEELEDQINKVKKQTGGGK